MRVLNQALTLTSLAVLMLGAHAPAALAASPSGKAIAVIQSTDILSSGNQRGLVPEAPVYMGDRIITDTGGEAQIQFVDDTRLVVGPGSSLLIDKFVFKGQTASNVTINAVRGTFRFITGNSPKNAYLIRTPTATLGLRGTRLDVSIGAKGETRIALYGEPNKIGIRVCDRNRRNCVDMKDRCDLVVVKPGGAIVRPQSTERAQILKTSFPYLKSQESLWSKFKVQPIGCGVSTTAFSNPNEGWAPTFASAPPPPPPPPPPVCGPGDGYGGYSHGKGDGKGFFGGSFGDGKSGHPGFFAGGPGKFGDGPGLFSGPAGKFGGGPDTHDGPSGKFTGGPDGDTGPTSNFSSNAFSSNAQGPSDTGSNFAGAGNANQSNFGGAGGQSGTNNFGGLGGQGGTNNFSGPGGQGGTNNFSGPGGQGGTNNFSGPGGQGGTNNFSVGGGFKPSGN